MDKEKTPSPPYQTFTTIEIKYLNLKVDQHTGGEWWTHDPKHLKENQLLRLLIILNIVCKSHIHIKEVEGNVFNSFFCKDSPWTETW